MFAARADQENLVYGQQTAAAAKPLNQGIKGLGAKTPGNKAPKTPFKIALNDENNHRGGNTGLKTGKKGDENAVTGAKKGLGAAKDAFVTPAGPRTRAPLGMKTTNAKAAALQTPAPLTAGKESIKTVSPRLRRPKVKIHQAETEKVEKEDEEPEIEYMPPRSVPLPDYPEDFRHDFDFSVFEGANLTRGMWSAFSNPIDENGVSKKEREEAEFMARTKELEDEFLRNALDNDPIIGYGKRSAAPSPEDRHAISNASVMQKQTQASIAKKPLSIKGPSTLTSKSAAAALSRPAPSRSTSSTSRPRFAVPTAVSKTRAPAVPTSRKQPSVPDPSTSATMRHAAVTAASKSTLGYFKGRAVSASARPPLSEAHRSKVITKKPILPQAGAPTKQGPEDPFAEDPELDDWIRRQASLLNTMEDDEDEANLYSGLGGLKLDDEDDSLRDFQLEIPEL